MATIVKYNSDLTLKENLKSRLQSRFQTTFETNDSNLAILADVIGDELIRVRNESIQTIESSQMSSASGEALNDLAFNTYGISRKPATKSEVLNIERNLYFYVDAGVFGDINNGGDITIPRGTRISSDQFFETNQTSIIYEVDSDYVLSSDVGIGYVGATALTFGFENNVDSDSLNFHNFSTYTDFNQGLLKVSNRYPILNGSEEETDNNLKFRLSNYIQAKTNLNIDNLNLTSLEINGLAEARIIPNYYGIGTVGVVLFGSGNQSNDRLENIFQGRVNELNFLNKSIVVSKGIKVFVDLNLKVFIRKNAFNTEEKLTLTRDIKAIIYDSMRDQENSSNINLNLVTEVVKRRVGSRDVIGFGERSTSNNSFEEVFLRKTDRDNLFPEEKEQFVGSVLSLEEDERLAFGIIEVSLEEVE